MYITFPRVSYMEINKYNTNKKYNACNCRILIDNIVPELYMVLQN